MSGKEQSNTLKRMREESREERRRKEDGKEGEGRARGGGGVRWEGRR